MTKFFVLCLVIVFCFVCIVGCVDSNDSSYSDGSDDSNDSSYSDSSDDSNDSSYSDSSDDSGITSSSSSSSTSSGGVSYDISGVWTSSPEDMGSVGPLGSFLFVQKSGSLYSMSVSLINVKISFGEKNCATGSFIMSDGYTKAFHEYTMNSDRIWVSNNSYGTDYFTLSKDGDMYVITHYLAGDVKKYRAISHKNSLISLAQPMASSTVTNLGNGVFDCVNNWGKKYPMYYVKSKTALFINVDVRFYDVSNSSLKYYR